MTEDGYIPAVLGEGNASKIIPAIEGLVFPYFTGCEEALDQAGRFGSYVQALRHHLLKQDGTDVTGSADAAHVG